MTATTARLGGCGVIGSSCQGRERIRVGIDDQHPMTEFGQRDCETTRAAADIDDAGVLFVERPG